MKITERQASNLSGKVHEALGAASVCWSPTPDGVFETERVLEIGADLMREIQETLGLEIEYLAEEQGTT